MILRRYGYRELPFEAGFLTAAHDRIAEASRLIDNADKRPALRVVAGPRGLFRVHARGSRIERAEVTAALGPADTDRLLTDARAALGELSKPEF
jgi:hypothetical protein